MESSAHSPIQGIKVQRSILKNGHLLKIDFLDDLKRSVHVASILELSNCTEILIRTSTSIFYCDQKLIMKIIGILTMPSLADSSDVGIMDFLTGNLLQEQIYVSYRTY